MIGCGYCRQSKRKIPYRCSTEYKIISVKERTGNSLVKDEVWGEVEQLPVGVFVRPPAEAEGQHAHPRVLDQGDLILYRQATESLSTHTNTHTHTQTHAHKHTHTHTHTHMQAHTHIYKHTHTRHTHACTQTHIHAHIFKHTHTRTHAHTHTHRHAQTHAHTQKHTNTHKHTDMHED